MSDVLERIDGSVEVRSGIFDCDIHPAMHANSDLLPFLGQRWRALYQQYGLHIRKPFLGTTPYPRTHPLISRLDAWPPTGGPPGSDLEFMRNQHLDPFGIETAVLQVLDPAATSAPNLELGAAVCSALNDWQVETWCRPEPRLKATIIVPQEYPEAAIAEIERCAADRNFIQIGLPPRANEPLGRRRYWPIYEAAVAAGLPVGIHVGSYGGHAPTGSGWPSFYTEEHHSNAHTMQALLTSLVVEGVPARFPTLKFIFIEGGFGWVPSLAWRLDKQWSRFRDEVPHLKRPPSEYIREQFWFTTQPIEEPERPRHLREIIDWIGWDRVMFSSDYPHWDFDDPRRVFKFALSDSQTQAIFRGNARSLYKIG